MHENEILVLLLGSVVLGFICLYRKRLNALPAAKWLFASYFATWVAWVSTVAEHLALPTFFNVLEHCGYLLNGALLFVWCWLGMKNGKGVVRD